MERLIERLSDRGARITMTDPRVTSMTNWFLAAIIVAMVGGFSWQLSTLSDLKQQNATLIAEIKFAQQVNSAQDLRLGGYDERLRALERAIK